MASQKSKQKSSGKKPQKLSIAPKERLSGRPPIVAILGHVDHGKTTLISKIKQKDLTKKEYGGISQHTGAYQIEFKGKRITFIDTPGHVVFSKMRSRGSKVADLVLLVVAADEGVKPQTIESLKHITEAKTPYLVVINKIDLPNINIHQVKSDLAKNNILVEGYGGNIVTVPVSAKTGEGIDELLEMILLMVDMAEIKADQASALEAVTLESRMDPRRGSVAVVLVRNGSLRVGEEITVENVGCKIKAILDENGMQLALAQPGQAVEVLGFNKPPPVGGIVEKKTLGKVIATNIIQSRDFLRTAESDENKLKIILRADVLGTLEAILESLPDAVKIIYSQTGNITESDILLAKTTKAEVVGFNIKVSSAISKLAQTEGVKVKNYTIIYDLLKDIEKKVLKISEPTIDEKVLGKAEILAEFNMENQKIAGCRVKEGQISKLDKIHLIRANSLIADCRVRSMKIGKKDIQKADTGEEFGVILSPNVDFKIGDMLISYRKVDE